MHKSDWLLIFAAVCCCSLLLLAPVRQGKKYLLIYENGKPVEQIALTGDRTFTKKFAHNEILIAGGKVSMVAADCPDHDCIKAGIIDQSGQIIACLPNRLSLRIVIEDADVDDVAK